VPQIFLEPFLISFERRGGRHTGVETERGQCGLINGILKRGVRARLRAEKSKLVKRPGNGLTSLPWSAIFFIHVKKS